MTHALSVIAKYNRPKSLLILIAPLIFPTAGVLMVYLTGQHVDSVTDVLNGSAIRLLKISVGLAAIVAYYSIFLKDSLRGVASRNINAIYIAAGKLSILNKYEISLDNIAEIRYGSTSWGKHVWFMTAEAKQIPVKTTFLSGGLASLLVTLPIYLPGIEVKKIS